MATEAKFTEDLVKGLAAPAEGRAEYRDTSTAGRYLRVTSAGAKSFSFVGRTKGSRKTERVTIGKWPAVKVKEAQGRALALSASMATGASAALAGRARREELTVGELFTEYLANSKARRPDIMQNVFRLYVEPSFGRRRLSELDHIKVATWHRGIPRMITKRKTEAAAAAGGAGGAAARPQASRRRQGRLGLNHKDHTSTAIYARLDLDPVRQSVERATSAMLEAAGMKDGAQVLPFKAA